VLAITTDLHEREVVNMEWTRSDTLALAAPQCAYCHGLGLRDGQDNRVEPCNCVLRQIFRDCYARFRLCVTQDKYISRSRLELVTGSNTNYNWGRKDEEYIADFCLVTQRTLTDCEYRIFKYHFLLGADWRLCCRKLQVDRGIFFHHVYRIQEKLGRVYRELEPYGLFPVEEYFDNNRAEAVCSTRRTFQIRPVRPPLRVRRPAA
jgi:hypothetical protein